MNQFGFKRQNSGKVLFHFDSLVDLHLAVVYALQKDYPSGGSTASINYSFLHQSKKELKQFRVFGIGKNIVQECFNEPVRNSYKTIYNEYLQTQFDRVIQDAPITLMLRLIAAFTRIGKNGNVIPSIFCQNIMQERIAKSLIKTLPVRIITDDEKNIDINSYARIIIGDNQDLDMFKHPHAVHITILNYGCNLQVVKNRVEISQDFVSKYGSDNLIEVIDSYRDIKPINSDKGDC